MEATKPVLIATVGAPQGVRGEVRLRAYTADPLAVGDYGPLRAADGRRFAVLSVRARRGAVVASLEGVTDRSAAEALRGTDLFVERAALADASLGEDEFFHADLEGLTVVDGAGIVCGTIVGIHDFGAGDILEIADPGGRRVMVPFTRAAVPAVDLGSGQVRIDPLAAGLVEADARDAAEPDR